MKIKLRTKIETVEEHDVELPVYHKHDLDSDYGSSIIYSRVSVRKGLFETHSIHVDRTYRGGTSYKGEIETRTGFDGSSADYHLGRGEYQSSQQEWEKVHAEAAEFFRSLA